MSLILIIYVVQVLLPALKAAFAAAAIIAGLVVLVSGFWNTVESEWKEDHKSYSKIPKQKRFWVAIFLGILLCNILPDKETSYVLLAAYGVQEIASNDKVQELGGKSLEVLEKAMDEYLKESETTKEEK